MRRQEFHRFAHDFTTKIFKAHCLKIKMKHTAKLEFGAWLAIDDASVDSHDKYLDVPSLPEKIV